jgi:3-methyladenine DNA glycosylase AlkD
MTAQEVKGELHKFANGEDALFLQGFFKTGEGQYGDGDVFIGVRMGPVRSTAKQFSTLPLREIQKLLDSEVHEHRMTGLIILTLQYPKADETGQQKIYDFYLANVYKGHVNNWDLIDVTCTRVVGEHLINRPRDILFEMARNKDVWQKRVAIISSGAFIVRGEPGTTLELAEILLNDEHDLIQKAVGWMLREVGKRCDRAVLVEFLDQHSHEMPRTMLRYSIEHLPAGQRAHYLKQKSLR